MNVAFIYKHTMTGQVLVVDIEKAKELESARPYWKLSHTINPTETLAFIIEMTPRQRNKYIKELKQEP